MWSAQVTHSSSHWREFAQTLSFVRGHYPPSNSVWVSLPLALHRFCHQLDFSTSGALCVALNKAAAGSAYRCFKERRVTKAYLALVRMEPGWGLGDIGLPPTFTGLTWPPECQAGFPVTVGWPTELHVVPLTWQVRGHVQESQLTVSYAIGRNSTEGRTHTMCIEGTQGTMARVGSQGTHPARALHRTGHLELAIWGQPIRD